ncbi:MAG: thiamine-phosphate kinase [Candidatus Electrothrix sp. AR5]|nr:thiamine-phosphate kinase [Candidatus Electrothrix sp. AR5]
MAGTVMTKPVMTERDIIDQIRNFACNKGEGLVQGIGDDCAVVEKDQQHVWLLTMDTLIESVHFDCSWHPPYLLGRKAVSVNVSDVAAMGGRPVFVLLSLGLPADFAPEWATELSRGINDACRHYGCLLIGGDTVCSPEKVTLTLTLIGEMEKDRVLYRHGACPGDTIWVSGSLGYAAAGLDCFRSGKIVGENIGMSATMNVGLPTGYPSELAPCIKAHLDPEARVGLARALAQTGCVHSMMDLSDGLATDLSHLCQQSRVGARIEAEKLPGRAGLAHAASLLNKKRIDWMIAGGEDYELLFTADPKDSPAILAAAAGQGGRVSPVGTVIAGQGVTLQRKVTEGNEEQPISFQGFDHFVRN